MCVRCLLSVPNLRVYRGIYHCVYFKINENTVKSVVAPKSKAFVTFVTNILFTIVINVIIAQNNMNRLNYDNFWFDLVTVFKASFRGCTILLSLVHYIKYFSYALLDLLAQY